VASCLASVLLPQDDQPSIVMIILFGMQHKIAAKNVKFKM
jgi:hypothetical protein